uniref:Reverse transcriptase zinc-binding domain-containing protein n=2 Tax=Poecilia formosa TaxID=48698 RepID=A0A087XGF1_POEFO
FTAISYWSMLPSMNDDHDIRKSYQWLEKAGLKDSTEALILAAQEQALNTRAIEAQIYHTRQDPRCRLCKEASETVQHITAGCKMLAGKAYMERHNQVASIVYRNICAEYGLEAPRSKWGTPPKVVENDRAKILWDFQIQTDKMVMANQPDIVVVDKEQRKAVVVDVAIPSDHNIRKKEHEKLEKYQGLREELEKAWKVKTTVVPVVIGALGAVTPKLEQWLKQIPGTTSDISVQKCAVLGTAKILRRTLKLPG